MTVPTSEICLYFKHYLYYSVIYVCEIAKLRLLNC